MGSGGSNREVVGLTELAEYLGIAESTVRQHWHEYGIPYVRIGKHVRFRMRNIETWLERRETEITRGTHCG